MQNHPDPFKKDIQTEKDIHELQNIFAICPVDKTTHNLAYVRKSYYQYVSSTEMGTKAYLDVTDTTDEQILANI